MIHICCDAVKNLCSIGLLRVFDYGVILLRVDRIVSLKVKKEVLAAKYAENGMSYISVYNVLHLPN